MIIPKASGIPLFAKLSNQSPNLFRKGFSHQISQPLNSLVNSVKSEKTVRRIEKGKSSKY